MKKILAILGCVIVLGVVAVVGLTKENYHEEYLRIHIIANSNQAGDQDIKYEIKDKIVEILAPQIESCTTKSDFERVLKENLSEICGIANEIVAHNNLDYKSSANVGREYIPTRAYDNFTLESGIYDSLVITLGEGKGDNWWCVVYPPLCFLEENVLLKSRILETIKKFFGG